ncbi:MAG: hypothetical protein V8S98_04985 [Lachnospiraceae bacterium]
MWRDPVKDCKQNQEEKRCFQEQLRQEAELRFQRQLPYFGQRKAEILCQMGQCSEEEQILMKFLYGTMPLRDVGVYDFSVFYGFARHALMLREQVAWCPGTIGGAVSS